MATETVLTNAKIVTPSEEIHGTIRIKDGVIADIETGLSSTSASIDCNGDYVFPGLIDIHTDNLERHIMPRTNAEWPVTAAIVSHDAQVITAGITTVLDALCIGTMGTGVRRFEKVKEVIEQTDAGKRNRIFRSEHLLHLRVELTNELTTQMFAELYKHPDVVLVSLMDHTPGQRQWANMENFIAMERKDYKLTEEQIANSLRMFEENQKRYYSPNRASLLAMVKDRRMVLASHDDTTLEHVEEAAADGIHISEFPTTLLAAQAARDRSMHIVAGSPNLVLGRSHSGNVAASDLARAGLLDVLSSDYVPSSLLYGAFQLTSINETPIHEALKTVTLNPAQLLGLSDRGSLEVGKRADVIRVRMVDQTPLVGMVWRAGERVA
jgi:alpha-D-ribose 1-methylphosphonate 5-triphosphate diphosphatase